jgi:hypothetical protein
VPPADFYTWLDQWAADSAGGARFGPDVVWASTAPVRSPPGVALGLKGTRSRTAFDGERADDAQAPRLLPPPAALALAGPWPPHPPPPRTAQELIAAMDDLRRAASAAGAGSSYVYTFSFLFYEQAKHSAA